MKTLSRKDQDRNLNVLKEDEKLSPLKKHQQSLWCQNGRPEMSGKTGKIVAVHSYKGGNGKTFIATNLAAALAKQGQSLPVRP